MALIITVSNTHGERVGELVAGDKTFSTGSVGYYAGDKLVLNGKRYQVSLSMVEIGSKPGSAPAVKANANGNGPVKVVKAGKAA